jgi:hypothetical protein
MADHVGTGLPPAEEIVCRYERESLAQHPYLQRIAREPVDTRRLWIMIASGWDGIIQHFSRWLANVTARVDDERLRSMLAKQLNDELGDGDYTRAHRLLYHRLLTGLDPFRPAEVTPEMRAPGKELSRKLEAIYFDPDQYVGIGASIVIEVLGKQLDAYLGKEMRRVQELTPDSMTWLTLHEELEIDHAEESMVMAHMVPAGPALEAAWRGGEAVGVAFWEHFDDLSGEKTRIAPEPILDRSAYSWARGEPRDAHRPLHP